MRRTIPLATLAAGLAIGAGLGVAYAETAAAPAAYVLVSGRVLDADGLAAYGEAAGPPAAAAGIEVLARGEADAIRVMEGEWPFDGFVVVERFKSMRHFEDFWNSPAYREAIELRAGKVELDFVIAVEAGE